MNPKIAILSGTPNNPANHNTQALKARLIPAWGEAPGLGRERRKRAEGPTHRAPLAAAFALTASTLCILGCQYFPESTFSLANDSRLPKWITLPQGVRRGDVQLTMSYYIKPSGRSAVFVLEDQKKHAIEKVSGKESCDEPFHLTKTGTNSDYPAYEAVTVNGITEMIEHRKMEPVFHVTDDVAVRTQYLAIGCGRPHGEKQ